MQRATRRPMTTMILAPSLALLSLSAAQGATSASAPQEEPAPVTWKDLSRSGFPLRFYGFLRLDAYYNTARMNSIILPATVSPEDGTAADDDDAGFALDPRLTRFGRFAVPVSERRWRGLPAAPARLSCAHAGERRPTRTLQRGARDNFRRFDES